MSLVVQLAQPPWHQVPYSCVDVAAHGCYRLRTRLLVDSHGAPDPPIETETGRLLLLRLK